MPLGTGLGDPSPGRKGEYLQKLELVTPETTLACAQEEGQVPLCCLLRSFSQLERNIRSGGHCGVFPVMETSPSSMHPVTIGKQHRGAQAEGGRRTPSVLL